MTATVPAMQMIWQCVVVMMGMVLMAGCGSPPRDVPDPQRVEKAKVLIAELEQRLESLRGLPPRERRAAYLALKPDLEHAVEATARLPLVSKPTTANDDVNGWGEKEQALASARSVSTVGYNYHSKALFWLANWRFLYANAVGVETLLDELDLQYPPVLLRASQALRVRLYLRQGRMGEAKQLTDELVNRLQITQLSGLVDLVAFYDRVGKPAPRVSDRNLSVGGQPDPLNGSSPFILAVFTRANDAETLFYLERMRAALAAVPEAHRPRLMQVTFEGSLLRASQMAMPNEDLLWANPNTDGSAERWQAAWKLPEPLPRNALIGPDRTLLAVELTPEQLSELAH